MLRPEDKLQGFVEEARHLTRPLNIVASDMIRDRDLAKKLDSDPDYFILERRGETDPTSWVSVRDQYR